MRGSVVTRGGQQYGGGRGGGRGRQLLIYDQNRGLKLRTPLTRENTTKLHPATARVEKHLRQTRARRMPRLHPEPGWSSLNYSSASASGKAVMSEAPVSCCCAAAAAAAAVTQQQPQPR
ncbi:unnamed protein product [Boreogadus saida]